MRTNYCGRLTAENQGEEVVIYGWVHRWRDHGGIVFIDMRDVTGLVQLAFDPQRSGEMHSIGHSLRSEDVLRIEGTVVLRPVETINPDMATGEVEVNVTEVEVLNRAETPPFSVEERADVEDVLRLRYRYIDLRREEMRDNLMLRHRVTRSVRSLDRKSTRLNSSHTDISRMPSSA